MTPRYLALFLLVAMLGFAGLMASVGFMVRDPLPITARHQTLVLESETLQPSVTVRLSFDGGFAVTLTITHRGRETPPDLVLAPFDGAPIMLDRESIGANETLATGQLTRPGRWEMTLSDGVNSDSFAFILQE